VKILDIGSALLIVAGLAVFEIITSIDNAVINADILKGMSQQARQWFLVYGLFTAVFIVRGLLPLFIVWAADPSIGLVGAFTATFSQDVRILEAVEASKPPLLVAGGVFLVILFFHWLFMEEKSYGLKGESFIHFRLLVPATKSVIRIARAATASPNISRWFLLLLLLLLTLVSHNQKEAAIL
jgi:hypothetical protein